MRTYTKYTDAVAKQLVDELPTIQGDPARYRLQMKAIGHSLGHQLILPLKKTGSADICVVCTVEDADFLARGLIEELEAEGLSNRIHLVCLWNDQIKEEGVSLSPIVRQYKEDFDSDNSVFVVIKAIISGACVVKTNLTRVISTATPSKIFVAAPVMLTGAEDNLSREFSSEINSKFEFVHFASDSEKDESENVVPGIGGSLYELLGFGGRKDKNKYVPEIVKERRQKIFGNSIIA